jgi:hypothetical protein
MIHAALSGAVSLARQLAQTVVGAFAVTLSVTDGLHDLSQLHRIARGNFLD